MKKIYTILITFLLVLFNLNLTVFAEKISTIPAAVVNNNLSQVESQLEPSISSHAAILINSDTGQILYQKNAYDVMYPASTTKMMTAILAIEKCNINEKAVASEYAITSIPSGYTTANIQIGEALSIRDLLYALMLPSANDAATIIAEHIGGSEAGFASMMNEKAKQIGCRNTHFVNANGIHNDEHVSTAYDLALIGEYCMRNPIFRELVLTLDYTLPATDWYPAEDRHFSNTNTLIVPSTETHENIYYYEYATGIKTGFTTPAQNTLVSSASKDGINLIAVVLYAQLDENGLSERNLDTIDLFEYGFNNYANNTLNVRDNANLSARSNSSAYLDQNDVTNTSVSTTSSAIAGSSASTPPDKTGSATANAPTASSIAITENKGIKTEQYIIDGITYPIILNHEQTENNSQESKGFPYLLVLIPLTIVLSLAIVAIILIIKTKKSIVEGN